MAMLYLVAFICLIGDVSMKFFEAFYMKDCGIKVEFLPDIVRCEY